MKGKVVIGSREKAELQARAMINRGWESTPRKIQNQTDTAFLRRNRRRESTVKYQSARRESNQIERPDRLRRFPSAKGAFHPERWPHLVPTRNGAPGSMQRSVYIHMVMIG